MSRMHRLFGVTMIEKGVSRLVSVDLGGAEQLLAAEESHPADLPQVAARHFQPFVSSVVGTNGGRNGRYGLSRTDNQTAQKHQKPRKPARQKLPQRLEPAYLTGPPLPLLVQRSPKQPQTTPSNRPDTQDLPHPQN